MIKSFKEYIKYRSVWMGVAIVWIMLFHIEISNTSILRWLINIGYGGVDIFFFASGIGCFYSLKNNPDVLCFFKKRLHRIFPTYIPFICIFFLVKFMMGTKLTLQEMLGNVFVFGSLAGMPNQFNWYLAGLLIFYLIAPYMVRFVISNSKNRVRLVAFGVCLLAFSTCFFNADNAIIIFTRLPIAYMGICMAGNEEQIQFNRKSVSVLFLLSTIGVITLLLSYKYLGAYLWKYGLHWYPFILIVPGMCYLISWCASKTRTLASAFSKVGEVSFELFLTHILLYEIADKIIANNAMSGKYAIKIVAFIASFIIVFGMKQAKKLLKRS